jgi:hypothetical protein
MTHSELQDLIIAACASLGLHVHHCQMNRSHAGFPDLVIIGRRVLWRELKVPPDTTTSKQRLIGYWLQIGGQDFGVWTPAEWESGEIRKELETCV